MLRIEIVPLNANEWHLYYYIGGILASGDENGDHEYFDNMKDLSLRIAELRDIEYNVE